MSIERMDFANSSVGRPFENFSLRILGIVSSLHDKCNAQRGQSQSQMTSCATLADSRVGGQKACRFLCAYESINSLVHFCRGVLDFIPNDNI